VDIAEAMDLATDEDYLGSIFRRCRNGGDILRKLRKNMLGGAIALSHSHGLACSTLVDEIVVTSSPVLERNDVTNKPNNHTSCQDHERENVQLPVNAIAALQGSSASQ